MNRLLVTLLGVILLVTQANAQLIPYSSTSPLYSQPSTADPGELRLPEAAANGTNYTAIKAPASITANVTFTWPGSLPTTIGCFTSDTAGILTIEECNFSLSGTHDWTGATTYATSGGLGLKPHGTATGNTTELRLLELAANGTNYVGFKGPDSIAANTIWTLPSADSSGCLKSNGSGTLSITSCATDITGLAYVTVGADATLTAERALTAGTGISLTDAGANSTLTVANTGVTSALAGTGVNVSGATGAVTITNTGVTSNLAGTGISVSGATGAVTVTNTGVTSLTGTANQVAVSGSTGAVTLSTPQDIGTGSSPAFANSTLTTALNVKSSTNQIVLDSDAAVNTGTITMASLNAARVWTFPNVTGTVITTGDTGTVTSTMLAGSIAASKLVGTDIATVGTITSGVWTGTAVGDSYITSALTAKTYASASQAAFTLNPYGASAGNTGEIRFLELAANGTSYVGFKATDSLAGTVIWTLPIADSSGSQCLASDGGGVLSWSACSGGGTAASQAEMELASSTTVFVSPGRAQYHPGVAKAVGFILLTGAVASNSYNISSVADTGVGVATVTMTNAVATTGSVYLATAYDISVAKIVTAAQTNSTVFVLRSFDAAGTASDPSEGYSVAVFGDQP